MINKGIILAGGLGTRMSPLTKAVNKHLMPIYDKPMIFYPLSILMLAKIKNILIIVNKGELDSYKKLLPNGKRLGIKITFKEQKKPVGLPDAFIIGKNFIKKDNVALILGDNFFYGQFLTQLLKNCSKLKNGAKILLHKVSNPKLYGVAKINNSKKIISIKEKPKKFVSNYAITGLYFFDNKVISYAKRLKPSKRGELEITDLLNFYRSKGELDAEIVGRGGAWLDTGSFENFYKTTNFVWAIQNQQHFKIACIEEIAFLNGWISKKNLRDAIKFYGKCDYSDYLSNIISND